MAHRFISQRGDLRTRILSATTIALLMASGGSALSGAAAHRTGHPAGLGQVLTSNDGGQIFGFDIDQAGNDGVLATASSVEIFDADEGKIVKSIGHLTTQDSDYVAYGIAAGDVALVDHEVVPDGELFPKRHYLLLNPVSGKKFTGKWTPPPHGIIVQQMAEDQSSSTTTLFALTSLKRQEQPILVVSDLAANTFSNVIRLNPDLFGVCNGPQLGQFTAANLAWIASSPDCGAVFGRPPINALIDLSTGKVTQFSGYNNGFHHAGSVNGGAVDPNTGVAATTTELNSQVEFYDLNKKKGITFVQLPCTTDTDQLNSGTSVTNDPLNGLFLVSDPDYCDGSQGGAIVVYDEKGNLIETITGFAPPKDAVLNPPPRINPSKRIGWAFGGPNGSNQLQQFFY
ncbi:MAG TPA: hypothetical protein VLC74_10860 [Rhizomicrobium sp.]|nr:hypothetical protein [Rhizomicrobium sp.]